MNPPVSHNKKQGGVTGWRVPRLLAGSARTLLLHGRIYEAFFSALGFVVARPSAVNIRSLDIITGPGREVLTNLLSDMLLAREDLVRVFGRMYAVDKLPADFAGTRIEAVVAQPEYLLIGEYGDRGARVALVTPTACLINSFYLDDPGVTCIHALYKSPDSTELIITTGSRKKYTDVWDLHYLSFFFRKRIHHRLGGHSSIARAGNEWFLGSSSPGRPNFIEDSKGTRYYFPVPCNLMYATRMMLYADRYLVCLSKPIEGSHKSPVMSIFDTDTRSYVWAETIAADASPLPDDLIRRAVMARTIPLKHLSAVALRPVSKSNSFNGMVVDLPLSRQEGGLQLSGD